MSAQDRAQAQLSQLEKEVGVHNSDPLYAKTLLDHDLASEATLISTSVSPYLHVC